MLNEQLLKLRYFDKVSDEEEKALIAACSGSRRIAAREIFVHAKVPQTTSNLLVRGIVARHMTLEDGSRQIVAIHVPGDFVDLHSFLLNAVEHDIEALTPVTIALFPHERLSLITETHPHLTRLLWMGTLIDASIHREWVLNVGRRRARPRIAHLLCELQVRLSIVGQATSAGFALPLTQADIGDACGLTPVHVNRVLRSLREAGIATIKAGEVRIHDLARLKQDAEFDPYYLHVHAEAD